MFGHVEPIVQADSETFKTDGKALGVAEEHDTDPYDGFEDLKEVFV